MRAARAERNDFGRASAPGYNKRGPGIHALILSLPGGTAALWHVASAGKVGVGAGKVKDGSA